MRFRSTKTDDGSFEETMEIATLEEFTKLIEEWEKADSDSRGAIVTPPLLYEPWGIERYNDWKD